jgi:two-component system sensor histidine kinase/response regulator
MNSLRQKPPPSWYLIVMFIIIFVSVIVVGSLYYNVQKKSLLVEKQLELSAISDLKIRQITQWRLDRLGNAKFLSENNLLVSIISDFLKQPTNSLYNETIQQSLKSLIENFDYKSVLLLDTNCNVRLSYPDQDTILGEHLRPLLPDIIRRGKITLSDLHKPDLISLVHIDLIIPLIDRIRNDTSVFGIMAIRIDPQKVLYPLIQSWPYPSKSAETLLLRRDGDEIVYLNELRHLKNSEMVLRKPVATEMLPASMALDGITGTLNGIDYRYIPVVAAMKKIPGTTWYMVAKIDRDEVFLTLNKQMRMVIAIMLLFILSLGLFLGFLWRNQRVRYYREKYEEELNRLALVKHFDYILKFANDIIFLIDSNLTIVEANDRALETYMYQRDEFIGMKLENIRAPETLSQLSEQLKIVNDNESATFETFHKRRDNSVFPIEISSRVVNIEGLKYYQTIGRDITERKAAEDTLRESEEKFRKIFEESPLCMVMSGKDFGIIRANFAFCKMIGYEEEELKSLTFKDFTHPDHISGDEISLLRLIAEEIPIYHTEKQYICKNNTVIWGSTTVSVIRSNSGEVQYFLGMVEDITSRREAAEELEKSFSLLKATLESTADGLLVVDLFGKIVQFNQKYAEMWRIPDEILDSRNDSEALNFVKDQLINPDSFLENVRQLYSTPEAITSDILEFKDGRFFERYSQPQKINGICVGRVWSFRDITEKKRAEADIIAAKEKAEESDRLKTAFLHNVSHEIRTPMNAIIGFSTLLNEPELSESERHQYVDIIFQSSNQLLSIINDIVDIANVESGQVKMNFREMNLNSSLRGLSEQFSYKEKEYNIPITLSMDLPDEEAIIVTDGIKLIQILSNLINNSVKFTREGQIDFGYVLKDGYLEFFVHDTGIGISNDHIDKIFNRFYQVDNAGSRQYSGTGLGLSICKAYVDLLGGKIWLKSIPNKGTQFNFTLPYNRFDSGK